MSSIFQLENIFWNLCFFLRQYTWPTFGIRLSVPISELADYFRLGLVPTIFLINVACLKLSDQVVGWAVITNLFNRLLQD